MESTNNSVASKFFTRTPSMIRRILRICDVVGRFLRKPFRFFPRIFSISGSILLSIRNLSHYRCNSYASVALGDCEVTFLREGEDAAFVHLSTVICLCTALQNRRSKSPNFFVFQTSGSI